MYPTINSSSGNDVVIVEMVSRKLGKLKRCEVSDKGRLIILTLFEGRSGKAILMTFPTSTALRGDVVVLRQPDAPEDLICKRIVLEAGERIPNNWNIFRELSVVSIHHY